MNAPKTVDASEFLNTPSEDALTALEYVLADVSKPCVAEIGVGLGATTMEILRLMQVGGHLHLYDFHFRLKALREKVEAEEAAGPVEVRYRGNGRRRFESYAWTLAEAALNLQRSEQNPQVYDLVYLDGAHTFHIDAPACVTLKEMIRPGGYIVFDDMYWSFANNPTYNPDTNPELPKIYSDSQLSQPHIEMVVDLFMRTDPRFNQVFLTENPRPRRTVFQRNTQTTEQEES